MSAVNPPRGMRDFLPAEKRVREQLLAVIRDTYRRYGFDEIETPVMEEIERLSASEGGENQKMTFNVLRRRLKPEEIQGAESAAELVDLGLRYDLTVPLSRFYATNRASLPTVFKSVQIAPVWRAERPQKGRYRQFMQCDIDIVGEAGVLAEAELFQATGAVLDALGVEGWKIRLNSRPFLSSLLDLFEIESTLQPKVLIELDKLDKLSAQTVLDQVIAVGVNQEAADALVAYMWDARTGGSVPQLAPDGLQESLSNVQALLTNLSPSLAERVVFDPTLIRGMGYYTGLIYEISVPGASSSIGGGGRYDGMIGKLSGVDAPAVGMSLGFERLVDLVRLPEVNEQDAVVLVYDKDVPPVLLLRFKAEVVATGARVRLEKRPKKMPEMLNRLSQDGYTAFATVRSDTAYLSLKPLG